MVKVKEDLTGKTFGRWLVLAQADDYIISSGKHYAQWQCQCSCEEHNIDIVLGTNLKSGHSTSCGCVAREVAAKSLTGNTYSKGKRKGNKKDLSGDYGIIWSNNTNEEIYFDLEDASAILQHTWWISASGYPSATIDNKNVTMHSFLGYYRPDHHNRNKLDNRRENLVPCTQKENQRNCSINSRNTSGFVGVSWDKSKNKWVAQITVDLKNIYLGRFVDKEDAIVARLRAEKQYFGEFAPQRHLFEQYNINVNIGDSDG